jgi:hypothetical protein
MSLRSVVLSFCLVVIAAVFSGEPRASADELIINRPYSGPRRDIEVDVHLTLDYGFGAGFGASSACDYAYGCYYYGAYGVGPGVKMLFPVVQNGFIPSLNNAFYVGFITDFLFVPYYSYDVGAPAGFFAFTIGPVVQWRFYLFHALSVFAETGFEIGAFFGNYDGYGDVYSFIPIFDIGGNWHFAKHVALTFSLGYPSTKVGVSFGF